MTRLQQAHLNQESIKQTWRLVVTATSACAVYVDVSFDVSVCFQAQPHPPAAQYRPTNGRRGAPRARSQFRGGTRRQRAAWTVCTMNWRAQQSRQTRPQWIPRETLSPPPRRPGLWSSPGRRDARRGCKRAASRPTRRKNSQRCGTVALARPTSTCSGTLSRCADGQWWCQFVKSSNSSKYLAAINFD